MKIIRRALLVLVLLLIVAGAVFYFSINRVVKSTVQSQASSSLNLQTTLNSANLSLFGGKLNLNQLQIASPPGYTAPQMLDVGDTNLAVSYGQLRDDPIHVSSITIDKPKLVLEEKNGVLNFKQAMDNIPPGDKAPSNKPPLKLIIDELRVNNPEVVVKGLPSGDLTVPIPSLTLKGVGTGEGANNGAAVKDVVMQVITAMAGSASNSTALAAEFKAILGANVSATAAKLGGDAAKRIAAAIPGDLGKNLSSALADPQALIKDPNKALNGLLGKNATTQPGDVKSQAENALQGLLNGKKNK
jgi:hypothetical protein